MNVFEKLNEARILFQNGGYKKSGKNAYAGYTYYELADILPVINKLGKDLKFTCVIEFTPELATLSFIDLERPEDKIVFTSPMSEASLKGCHAVQNLGAVETYIKRYLYQNCFEIVEADVLDCTMNPNDKTSAPKSTGDKELDKLIDEVQVAIQKGRLVNGFKAKAEGYIKARDKQGLLGVIDYLAHN